MQGSVSSSRDMVTIRLSVSTPVSLSLRPQQRFAVQARVDSTPTLRAGLGAPGELLSFRSLSSADPPGHFLREVTCTITQKTRELSTWFGSSSFLTCRADIKTVLITGVMQALTDCVQISLPAIVELRVSGTAWEQSRERRVTWTFCTRRGRREITRRSLGRRQHNNELAGPLVDDVRDQIRM